MHLKWVLYNWQGIFFFFLFLERKREKERKGAGRDTEKKGKKKNGKFFQRMAFREMSKNNQKPFVSSNRHDEGGEAEAGHMKVRQ